MNPLSPTISRNAVGRTLFRGTRSGAGAPDHSPRPNLYPPKVWRPPRSKQGTRQDYVPPLVLETQHQLPRRAERKRQWQQGSSIGPRRDEVERMTNPHPLATSVEQPASSYPYQSFSTELDRGHRRYPRAPYERIRFPERRPNRTRHISSSAQEDPWRELPSSHRASKQRGYLDYPTSPHIDYNLDRDHCRHIPRHERYSTSFDPSYIPPTFPYDNVSPIPSRAGNKRCSWSSDSSSSSVVSWSSSSPTIRSSSLPLVRPHPHESDIKLQHSNHSHWSRSHGVETTHGWIVDDYFVPSGDLSVVDDDEYVRSPYTDHYSSQDGDLGQTIVYTDCEIVAHDPRTADPHQRTHNFNGMSVVHLPREAARRLDPLNSSDVDGAERSRRVESREFRRRKRPYLLPIWSELLPRNMKNLRREEGIRYRFHRDSDDTPEPDHVCPEPPHRMDDNLASFPPRRNKSRRRRQDTRHTFRQHNPSY